jgi:UTP--glucose-1-phosphate uridylyltransferase
MQAEAFVGNEPFVVAYPDDLHFGKVPLVKQLVKKYNETGCCVMSALHNPPQLERYGVLALSKNGIHVTDIVEKPATGKEPSKEASIGRFLFTPDIFKYLREGWKKHIESGNNGEYFHVYALKKLMDKKQVAFQTIEGERLDIGTPSEFLRAIIKYAKKDSELLAVIKEETKEL